MITDLGSLSLGVIVPGAAAAQVDLVGACDIAAPNVNAQLTGVGSFTPSVSLSFSAQIAIANNIITSLTNAIAAGITPPTLSAQVALAASVTAQLTAMLATISGYAAFAAALESVLATAGVRLLTYDGQQDLLGGELATALGASAAQCNALVILTTSGATWTTMSGLFKTS